MNKISPHKNRLYRAFLAISTAVSLALIVALILINQKLKRYENEELIPLSQYEDLKFNYSNLQTLTEIDQEFITSSNVDRAISKYEDLLDANIDFKQNISKRIKRLNEILESQNTDGQAGLEYQILVYQKAIDSLKTEGESLRGSMQNELEQLVAVNDSLMSVIRTNSAKINRAEVVKVISFKNNANQLIHYLGEIQNGKANGNGVGIWDNGSIYRGEWIDNVRHGKGVFSWADGAKYEGDFNMGIRSGNGTFYYKSGEKYIGEFKDGVRHGQGVLYDRDNNVSYNGQWKNDKPI